jgi:replicative DNA helicase
VYGEKLPPHDTDAEEAVIGSLLIDGTAIYKIATFIWGVTIALPAQ